VEVVILVHQIEVLTALVVVTQAIVVEVDIPEVLHILVEVLPQVEVHIQEEVLVVLTLVVVHTQAEVIQAVDVVAVDFQAVAVQASLAVAVVAVDHVAAVAAVEEDDFYRIKLQFDLITI
jgi:hypothetical protein